MWPPHEQIDLKHESESLCERTSLSNGFQGKQVKWEVPRYPTLPAVLSGVCACCLLNSLMAQRHSTHKQVGKASGRNLGAQMEQFVFWNYCLKLFMSVAEFLFCTSGPVGNGRKSAPQLSGLPGQRVQVTVGPVACMSPVRFTTTQQSTLRIMGSSVNLLNPHAVL